MIVSDAEQTGKVPACAAKVVSLHATLRKWYPNAQARRRRCGRPSALRAERRSALHPMPCCGSEALRAACPAPQVVDVGGDVFTSFTTMVYAPFFIKDSSSFGLWAGMANNGTVVSPRLWAFVRNSFDNPHWVWSDAPVLYPELARQLNLTLADMPAVMEYLQTN